MSLECRNGNLSKEFKKSSVDRIDTTLPHEINIDGIFDLKILINHLAVRLVL